MKKEYKGPGKLPILKWLPKDCFVVDYHYQRKITGDRSQALIGRIAAEFSWSKFQPPTVTNGPKGKYIVIDGQHRIAGATQCDKIKEIPVYIVPDLDQKEQAQNFVSINRDRVILHPLTIYHAQLNMGDEQAKKVHSVCEEADISIARQPAPNGMTAPRETAALGTIKQGLRLYGEAPVIAALMIIPDAYKMTPGMIRSRILKALIRFFHKRGVRDVNRRALILVLKENSPVDLEAKSLMKARKKGGNVDEYMLGYLEHLYDKAVKNG